jgi:hypothetical protein
MNSTRPAAPTSALHVAIAPEREPGEPVPATQTLTAAQRQWAYRQRSKRAMTQAIGDEAHASRVSLLALLGRDLVLLGDDTAHSMHSAARSSARRVINALVTRYDVTTSTLKARPGMSTWPGRGASGGLAGA